MEYILIEFNNNSWKIQLKDNDYILNTKIVSNEKMLTIMDNLSKKDFLSVYFSKKSINDLSIITDEGKIIIKNYEKIQKEPPILKIKNKVNSKLSKLFFSNVKKNLKDSKGKIAIFGAAVLIAIVGGYNLKKSSSNEYSKEDNNKSIVTQDDTKEKDNANKNNVPKTQTNNQEKLILNYLNKYKSVFNLNDSNLQEIYNECKSNKSLSENEVISEIYSYYENNLYEKDVINYNDATEEEQEEKILSYAKIYGINDEDTLATLLAIHELESGHGKSEWCRNYNNLGGIFGTNPYTNEWEIKKYPNLDVAAIDFVNVFLRIKEQCKELDSYDPNQSLEYNMNPIYCTEKMSEDSREWYEAIGALKENIRNNDIEKINNTSISIKH